MQKEGIVVKGLGGLYEVRFADGETAACRGKGILKRDDGKLLIGDRVTVALDESGRGETVIECVSPRKNALIRPPLSNVTLMVLTAAAVSPAANAPSAAAMIASGTMAARGTSTDSTTSAISISSPIQAINPTATPIITGRKKRVKNEEVRSCALMCIPP